MTELAELIRQGSFQAWLYVPLAVLLGALHGLEPGHSKTMMAAFIIAIHGTVKQAVLLGLAATASHTAIVWVVALAGLYFGSQWQDSATQPYFEIISGIVIVIVSFWIMMRIYLANRHYHDHCDHDHSHERRIPDPRHVTTGQIVMFGLTGGLLPCPAAITVLILCLQVKQLTLGTVLVLGFSVGLAITLVGVGVAASYAAHHAAHRWPGFDRLAQRAPYLSSTVILLLGLYLLWHGFVQIL